MLSQRRRAPVSSKLTRCHPTADTPTIDVHVNRVNRDHPLSAIHPARRRPRCPARCCCRRPRRHCRPSFDHVRRLQRGFRCRVMSFPTTDKNPHTLCVRTYIVRCFFSHFFFLSFSFFFFFSFLSLYTFALTFQLGFHPSSGMHRDRSSFFFSFLSFFLSLFRAFHPGALSDVSRARRAEPRISQVGGKIGSLTTRPMQR